MVTHFNGVRCAGLQIPLELMLRVDITVELLNVVKTLCQK